ncbi:MAG: UDP-N-acetylmuramate--L-alanine ligase [Bacteroidetes bacterium]|nr:MAG: UDP-N-acetylmuramate--L-alanine ligase [Bacteroidota bacterium]
MKLGQINNIYLLGIGGIGMSALARYYNVLGVAVFGYDKTPTKLTDQLIKEGIAIHFEDDVEKIPKNLDLVIYTPAIPEELKELVFLSNSGVRLMKRSEVLGMISESHKTIAVAGTHGKTTVTTLIAWLLVQSTLGCTAFFGGIAKDFGSNMVTSTDSDLMVVEADEYDKSFLRLFPDIAVVTSVDADHLDIYGNKNSLVQSFNEFISQAKDDGIIIMKKGLGLKPDLNKNQKTFSYALEQEADYFAFNLILDKGVYSFDLQTPDGILKNLTLGIPGLFNVENAVAAIAVALILGVDEKSLRQSLKLFSGIDRRFNILVNNGAKVYIDDYAHHPKEIEAALHSIRKMFPGKKILGVFQPHLYSRTRDFATEFGKSLGNLDELVLLPIYPAREKPVKGVDSTIIAEKVKNTITTICEKEDLVDVLKRKDFDVLITMGAGDIDRLVESIVELIK